MFSTYFELGLQHILDINAYDHLLFIIALFAIFKLIEWKKALILVTAFTLGHSLTLALAVYDKVIFPVSIIEFLIPLSIFITCLVNFYKAYTQSLINTKHIYTQYALAFFFGLIHGSGFSNYLKSLLMPDETKSDMLIQLLGFNLGIEAAQIIIVLVLLGIASLAQDVLKLKRRYWVFILSGIAALISLTLLYETKFW